MFLSETKNEQIKSLMLDALSDELGEFHGATASYFESGGYVGMRLDFPGDMHFYKTFPVEWADKYPEALAKLYAILALEAWKNATPEGSPLVCGPRMA